MQRDLSDVAMLVASTVCREWVDDMGQLWHQHVSVASSSRDECKGILDRLDPMLEEQQARKQPLCPLRERIFSQVSTVAVYCWRACVSPLSLLCCPRRHDDDCRVDAGV